MLGAWNPRRGGYPTEAAQDARTCWMGRLAGEASQRWTAGLGLASAAAAAAPFHRHSGESLPGRGCQEYWEGPSGAGTWRIPVLKARRRCGGAHGFLKKSNWLWLTVMERTEPLLRKPATEYVLCLKQGLGPVIGWKFTARFPPRSLPNLILLYSLSFFVGWWVSDASLPN